MVTVHKSIHNIQLLYVVMVKCVGLMLTITNMVQRKCVSMESGLKCALIDLTEQL